MKKKILASLGIVACTTVIIVTAIIAISPETNLVNPDDESSNLFVINEQIIATTSQVPTNDVEKTSKQISPDANVDIVQSGGNESNEKLAPGKIDDFSDDPGFFVGDSNTNNSFASSNIVYNDEYTVYYKFYDKGPDAGLLQLSNHEVTDDGTWKLNHIDPENGTPEWIGINRYVSKVQIIPDKDENGNKIPWKTNYTKSWFSTASALGQQTISPHVNTIIDLEWLDMSEVKDASLMCAGVGYNFALVNPGKFKLDEDDCLNMPNLENATGMFASNRGNIVGFGTNAVKIKHENSDNHKLTELKYMFEQNKDLKEIDIESLDISEVKDFTSMFRGANSLQGMYDESADLHVLKMPAIDTTNITSANSMFEACRELTTIDLRNWSGRPEQGRDFQKMFYRTSGLKMKDTETMVKPGLQTIVTERDTDWSTSKANFTDMFGETDKVPIENTEFVHSLTGSNGTKLIAKEDGSYYVDNTYAKVDRNYYLGENNELVTVQGYFSYFVEKTSLAKASSNNATADMKFYNDYKDHTNAGNSIVYEVPTGTCASIKDVPWHRTFIDGINHYKNITNVAFVSFDTTGRNMKYWFNDFEKLKEVPVDTKATEYYDEQYKGCKSLTTMYISNNIKTVGLSCFENCTSLKKVVVENGDGSDEHQGTSEIKTYAFKGCSSLENFVVRKTSDDNITYGTDVFKDAGSSDPCVAAPLIFASSSTGKTASLAKDSLKKPFYNYVEIESPKTAKSLELASGNYYYLTDDYKLSSRTTLASKADAVLDLAGHNLDRGLTTPTKNGHVILIGKNQTLRVDSTVSIDEPDVMGCITGANVQGGSSGTETYRDDTGGGIFVIGTCNMVNGNVSSNVTDSQGAGICVSNPTYTAYASKASEIAECKLNMYGGYIKDNTETGTSANYGGGGVNFRGSSTGNFYGGNIVDNIAKYHGAGVFVGMAGYNTSSSTDVVPNMFKKTTVKFFGGNISNNKLGTKTSSGLKGDVYFRHGTTDCISTADGFEAFAMVDCNFTMENSGIECYKITDKTNKKAVIDKSRHCVDEGNGSYYMVHVPTSITAADGSTKYDITGINNSAFQNDNWIKKVVVECATNTSSVPKNFNFIVGDNAFNGASHLETWLVKASVFSITASGTTTVYDNVNDNTTYGTNAFKNAGNRETTNSAVFATSLTRPALIMAGGANTIAAAQATNKAGTDIANGKLPYYYTYCPTHGYSSKLLQTDRMYLYMDGTCNRTDDKPVNFGSATTGIDGVWDFNGYTLDTYHSAKWSTSRAGKADHWGIQIVATSVSKTTPTSTNKNVLRLDDTSTLQQNYTSGTPENTTTQYNGGLGRVTGGENTNNMGGGINCSGVLKMVNGNIYQNAGVEGAGVSLNNGITQGKGLMFMYGGAIYGNIARSYSDGTSSDITHVGGGGVLMKSGTTFNMYDGWIVTNQANARHKYVKSNGGGVRIYSSQTSSSYFNMYGGHIGSTGSPSTLLYHTDLTTCEPYGGKTNKTGGAGISILGASANAKSVFNMQGGQVYSDDNAANARGCRVGAYDGSKSPAVTTYYFGKGIYVNANALFYRSSSMIEGYTKNFVMENRTIEPVEKNLPIGSALEIANVGSIGE